MLDAAIEKHLEIARGLIGQGQETAAPQHKRESYR